MTEEALKNLWGSAGTGSKCLDYYTTWSETYDKDLSCLHYHPPRVLADGMAELFPPGNRDVEILDCCAGTGLVAAELRREGFTTIDALDGCEAMLKKAAEKKIYRSLICDRLGTNKLKIDDNRYDVITGGGILVDSHVKEDCFPELIRVVKPGGKIVLTMCERYITEGLEFLKNVEPEMQRLHDAGQWKRVMRRVVPDYTTDPEGNKESGILYVFEVL